MSGAGGPLTGGGGGRGMSVEHNKKPQPVSNVTSNTYHTVLYNR